MHPMILNDRLNKLANLFPAPLYVVGGAVRDHLAGFGYKDIDLASALMPAEVFGALEGTDFFAIPTSPKLGTLKIKSGNQEYEYTGFRKDSYSCDGSHTPQSVSFTTQLSEDALRRDFTVDAVYYDIKDGKYVDPLGGIADIQNKLMRAVRNPKEVMQEDGLRLLRLVRIACSTGFDIAPELYGVCKSLAPLLQNIHKSRIGDEFAKIIVCDTENGIKGAHTRAIRMMIDLGLMQFVLPELMEGGGFPQRADHHKYDVLDHIIEVFDVVTPEVRIAALFHDISKPGRKLKTGKMAGHEIDGAELLRKRLAELCFPHATIERNARLVRHHMYDLKCDAKESTLRHFIQRNADILDDLIVLKDADYVGSGIKRGRNPAAVRMESLYRQMVQEGVPFGIKDLKVGGAELIELGIPEAERGKLLAGLVEAAALDKELRTHEGQYKYLQIKEAMNK